MRCLDPAQIFARRGTGHQPLFLESQTVDDREDRNGASVGFKRAKQAFDHRARKVRPRRVVDQHGIGAFDSAQRPGNRLLTSLASGDEGIARQSVQRRVRTRFAVFGDRDDERGRPGFE